MCAALPLPTTLYADSGMPAAVSVSPTLTLPRGVKGVSSIPWSETKMITVRFQIPRSFWLATKRETSPSAIPTAAV